MPGGTDLGDILRRLRRAAGLTQEELAERSGLSVRSVRSLESRNPPRPRKDSIHRLAAALDPAGGSLEVLMAAARGGGQNVGIDPGTDLPAATATPTAERRRWIPAQVPADVLGFAGRAEHLTRLDALLDNTDPTPTAVVISVLSGTAGVGKTALAIHWAHRVVPSFPDGQLYVNLHGFEPAGRAMAPADALRDFLGALGVPGERVPATVNERAALYRSLLAGRRVLVVLDNAYDAEQVRPLLPGDPNTMVLVTSRDRLTPLVATHGARPLHLDVLPAGEARELLGRRLGDDRIAAEPGAVDDIIDACAGLPLALAIVAARAQESRRTLAVIATELAADGRLDALDAGDDTSEVRAAFAWSYTSLGTEAARLFRLLGLHAGPYVSVPAVARLADRSVAEARRLLAELHRGSLITEVAGRYTFHDLLRIYAADLAHAHDTVADRRGAVGRLLAHYSGTTYRADRLLRPSRQPSPSRPTAPHRYLEQFTDHGAAMAWLNAEHPVLLAAVRQAAEESFDTECWQLAWALDTFLDRGGHWPDLVEAWTTAISAADRLGDAGLRAYGWRRLAHACTQLGCYEDAEAHLRHALDLYTATDDAQGQASASHDLAILAARQGRFDRALDHATRAHALHVAGGSQKDQAYTLNQIGWYHARLGAQAEALAHCQEALALFRHLGDRPGEAATSDSLGYIHHQLGRDTDAIRFYRSAVDAFRDIGDRYYQADTLVHLGDAQDAAGDPDAAHATWTNALHILIDLDHPDADDLRHRLIRTERGLPDLPKLQAGLPVGRPSGVPPSDGGRE
jgi:tetratricopeptide (TPR) repeat protein/transcriptional regulator with XRE-family HTH domain